MHTWLASYRERVIDPVARATEANDETRATLMMIMESPGAGYRSTAQLEAVREYVRIARKPFDLRRNKVPNIHNRQVRDDARRAGNSSGGAIMRIALRTGCFD